MADNNNSISLVEKMKEIADGCMGDAPAYCVAACPMQTDAKGYIGLIKDRKYEEALKKVREALFLPGTLGRICAHPCEEKCKRGEMRNPLSIAALKRFVADRCDDESLWDLTTAPERAERVAIIGAGPAGAQAALDLRRKGYQVTVYDRLQVKGGMLRVGIPEHRLPREVIEKEYSLLEKIGVKFVLGVDIGKDIPFDNLTKEHDAVLIAVGAHIGNVPPLPGNDFKGIFNAVEFLRKVSLTGSHPIGKSVVVVGGGCVGIDAARTARRLGAEDVHLICLEGRDEMPAHDWEIKDSKAEGIKITNCCGVKKIVGSKGKVNGLTTVSCVSVFDKEGRFCPVFDNKNTETIKGIDNIIFAIGQGVDGSFASQKQLPRSPNGRFRVDPVTLQTAMPNVFAAGDATGRSVIVIEAMAEGRRAAESIDRYLNGRDLCEGRADAVCGETKLETVIAEDEPNLPRVKSRMLKPKERVKSFAEADLGFDEKMALEEAARCFQCECKLCMKECEMLSEYSSCPGQLFKEILAKGDVDPIIPYSCNMCSQCTIVCPKEFKMMDRFMDIRIQKVCENNGHSPMKGHKAIDMHQLLGFSKFFTTTIPAKNGVQTKRVFIPGCSLPSYSPQLVANVLEHLQERLPDTGAILKCCGKPTKALGQVEAFRERYAELQAEIDALGAEEIIVACQSCYMTMMTYSPNQKVRSLWELLPEIGLPAAAIGIGRDSEFRIAIHDSCPTRDQKQIHKGIRSIMKKLGYRVEEPKHTKESTRCCGFGGMVVPANPELAFKVMKRRTEEVKSDVMVTYCAACRESMIRGGKRALHILDLVFGGPWKGDSQYPGINANPIVSWMNRYKAKRLMRKTLK